MGKTVQKEAKWLMDMLSTEYTVFGFTVSFGKHSWEIGKRYSDFDKLDNRVTTFLLPFPHGPTVIRLFAPVPRVISMACTMPNANTSTIIPA